MSWKSSGQSRSTCLGGTVGIGLENGIARWNPFLGCPVWFGNDHYGVLANHSVYSSSTNNTSNTVCMKEMTAKLRLLLLRCLGNEVWSNTSLSLLRIRNRNDVKSASVVWVATHHRKLQPYDGCNCIGLKTKPARKPT